MGTIRAVVDSDVLIDFLQGIEAARSEINRYNPALYSVISWMEVMCGTELEQLLRMRLVMPPEHAHMPGLISI